MSRLVMSWIRFAFTAPWSLLGWFWASLCCLLWLADYKKLRWEDSGLVTTEWRPWFAKRWNYSTTLGRAIIFYPGVRDAAESLDERLERHERIHVWQIEDLMFLSFWLGVAIIARTGDWKFGIAVWISGGFWQLTNFVTAILRFSHNAQYPKEGTKIKRFFAFLKHLFVDIAYRDSEHERSAYAQTAVFGSLSWWELREDKRQRDLDVPDEDFDRPV